MLRRARLIAALVAVVLLVSTTPVAAQFTAQIQQALQQLGLWPYGTYSNGQVPVWNSTTNQFASGVPAGSVTGGTCTNQVVTAVSTSAVPTCTTVTSAYVNTSIWTGTVASGLLKATSQGVVAQAVAGTDYLTPTGSIAGLTGTIASATQDLITRLGTIVSGVWQGTKIGLAYGGTNADLSATGGTSQVLQQTSTGAAITVGQLSQPSLSDYVAPTTPAFDAAVFTSDSGTWVVASGDRATFNYTIVGKLMVVQFRINTSTVTGTPTFLQITIPASKLALAQTMTTIYANDNSGGGVVGYCDTTPGGSLIRCAKNITATAWSPSTDATLVWGTVTFPIQ